MFILKTLLTISIINFSPAYAAVEYFKTIHHPIEGVFVPNGFDDNDSVQFVIHGNFPSSCFQVGTVNTELDAETGKLSVDLRAYQYVGDCSKYPSPFHLVVHVGLLRKAGSYGIYDRSNNRYLGAIEIEKAKPGSAGTDERGYPPVLDAFLQNSGDGQELVLRGVVPWSCLGVGEIKIIPSAKVVVVLPQLVQRAGEKCEVGEFAYEIKRAVTEPLPRGEFLLHVRSMGGQSVNKMIFRAG